MFYIKKYWVIYKKVILFLNIKIKSRFLKTYKWNKKNKMSKKIDSPPLN